MNKKHYLFPVVLVLCFMGLKAQNRPYRYEERWKNIDSLISNKGLVQTALSEINILYEHAKNENNQPQLLKALIYKWDLQEKNQQDAEKSNLQGMTKEIETAAEPQKSILTSILAETYWSYFQRYRWEIYKRSATIHFLKADMATWGADDFYKKVSQLFLASVSDEKILQQTKLESFEAIIMKGNVRYLRPTLYDLLAHRALAYFKSDETDVMKPSYHFELNDPAVFADKDSFAYHLFKTMDSASAHLRGLQLYQKLLLFHDKDARPDALIAVDIERIQFAYQYAVMSDKENLHLRALQNITGKYPGEAAAAEAWYLQAEQFASKAGQYAPLTDTNNRFDYLPAKEICEKVVTQKDSSEGKTNCQNLLYDILQKEISLEVEKVNVPNKPFRALVSYKNCPQLFFRMLAADRAMRESLGAPGQPDYWEKLTQLPLLRSFEQRVPQAQDYQMHSAEIKIDSLPAGEYALLASTDPDFGLEKNQLAVLFFYVSDISYISFGNDYFILNRETGQPMARTNVQAWYRYYDRKFNRYLERKGENFSADANGFFTIVPSKTGNNDILKLEFTASNDHLFIDEGISQHSYGNTKEEINSDKAKYETENLETFFFTDRSIYRPGQTVYFKGLVVTKDFESRQSKILSGFPTRVFLYDANDDKVDSVVVATNDYGSYHGKFKLPENLLNGQFKISDDSTQSQQLFSVEEYKRPSYCVNFEKPAGSFRVDDSVHLSGSAKAYAGNPVNGARVKYRVIRLTRYPHPGLFSNKARYQSQAQEIAQGEAITDGQGRFFIDFRALPDRQASKVFHPVFTYQVSAEVTDINGETRNGDLQVPVGYQSLNLFISLPGGEQFSADSLSGAVIRTENLNGTFQAAGVKVAVYKLKSPDRLIRARYWNQPDQFVMSREEYLSHFPTDEYSDETNRQTWDKTEKIFEDSTLSQKDFVLPIRHGPLSPGWYRMEASATDKYGDPVTDIVFFQLLDPKTGTQTAQAFNWNSADQPPSEPGQDAKAQVGTSARNVFVIGRVSSRTGENPLTPGDYFFSQVSAGKKDTVFHISEKDRGGFGVYYAFVKDNRFYTSSQMISVPWSNKQLAIHYETYRDKSLPGQEEKWKVRISGYKKDKVAAEILTSMYDASLDQFRSQGWSMDLYQTATLWDPWSQTGFSSVTDIRKNPFTEIRGFQINYDGLIGDEVNESRVIANRGRTNYLPGANYLPGVRLQGIAKKTFFTDADKEGVAQIAATVPGTDNANGALPESGVQIRKDFKETAFFFPDLKTDTLSNIEFSFMMPETLTSWKWMLLAHTKDLSFGYATRAVITQKQLMVQPNAPRFLREGDHLYLTTKIVNLTDSEMTGQVELQLLDAQTRQPVDGWFQNIQPNQFFTVSANHSEAVTFSLQVPYQFNKPITYRFIARSNQLTDGEENTIPVLSNRVLVTETLPLNMSSTGKKEFKFQKLLSSSNSETLTHQSLTVVFTSNPAWEAVLALPYLMESPYACTEQTFNRFYANALGWQTVNSSPRIQAIFKRWETSDSSSLISNLQKNMDLKSVLLQETPWVLDANSESGQRKNIASFFDLSKMAESQLSALQQLQQAQQANGGFAWFTGGPDDRYITAYMLAGIGHLKKLSAVPTSSAAKVDELVRRALAYLDNKIKEDYDHLIMSRASLIADNLGALQIQYLYMRSFFGTSYPIAGNIFPAVNYYRKQTQQYWLQQNKYLQGMIALELNRSGDIQKAKDILASLRQTAIQDEEMGTYWKENTAGLFWQQSPVEAQSLLIEVFSEIAHDDKMVGGLKRWLLKQKQTENWKTTKATADACYALLLAGTPWLGEFKKVDIQLGHSTISSSDQKAEAGTGYFKKTIEGSLVHPEMGNISVTVSASPNQTVTSPSWGAVYWQYLEDLDKISVAASPLQLTKKIFKETSGPQGPWLEPVSDNGILKVGDKVIVRITLKTDRDLEYVHMKDMRASSMEPVNVISGFKWQDGLGYYESTKDASTNFFFSWVPRGTHVFEYALYVTNTGSFTCGLTTIQCMYAPEFSAHSEGLKIHVE